MANRWLAVRLESLGAVVSFLAALFTGTPKAPTFAVS